MNSQVEVYRARHGVYPQVVLGDALYGTRGNLTRFTPGLCAPQQRPLTVLDDVSSGIESGICDDLSKLHDPPFSPHR